MENEILEEAQMAVETNGGDLFGAGAAAAKSITESTSTFMAWLKSYLNWDNFFKVLGAVIIILAITLVYKLVVRAIKNLPEEKLSSHKSLSLLKFLHYIYVFALVMYILGFFGVKLSAIWGAAGVAGVALAFAAQTSVSNIISGIFIYAEKSMRPGDLITVGSETGIVDVVGLMSVQVHTTDNQLIRIPNSTIINSNMVNATFFPQRRMCIGVSVSYDTDMEKAMEALMKAPALCKHVVKTPAPAAWFDSFGESGINMVLAIWFNSQDFLLAKNETFVAIKKVLDDAGIEIPYNKLDVKVLGTDAGSASSLAVRKMPAVKAAKKTQVKKAAVKKPAAKKAVKKTVSKK